MSVPSLSLETSVDEKWKEPVSAPSIAEVMGRRPKILVVDDQPMNIQALFRVFSADHQVFMATTGTQAILACEEKAPDLMLLDIEIPDINGFDVCERLRANPLTRHIPIIFVTSHTDPAIEARGLSIGAVDFITKPISREIVRARVRTHLLLKQQSDLLRQWVYIDGLTTLYNRRYFDERFSGEWGRVQRHGGPLSVLLMDVDRFKLYNDRYGHQMGDETLRRVAVALKGALKRSADLLARYGGEEFVCLLPDTDFEGACNVARRMNEGVCALEIEHLLSPPQHVVSVSIGLATYTSGAALTADGLIKLADEQLYKAKEAGRNRFHGEAPIAKA